MSSSTAVLTASASLELRSRKACVDKSSSKKKRSEPSPELDGNVFGQLLAHDGVTGVGANDRRRKASGKVQQRTDSLPTRPHVERRRRWQGRADGVDRADACRHQRLVDGECQVLRTKKRTSEPSPELDGNVFGHGTMDSLRTIVGVANTGAGRLPVKFNSEQILSTRPHVERRRRWDFQTIQALRFETAYKTHAHVVIPRVGFTLASSRSVARRRR